MSGLEETFTRKLGPLPAWTWVALGAGVGFWYLHRKGATPTSSLAGIPNALLGTGGGAAGNITDTGGGGGGGNTDTGGTTGTTGHVWDGILGSDSSHPAYINGPVLTQWIGGQTANPSASRWMTYAQAELDKLTSMKPAGPWRYVGLMNGTPTFQFVGNTAAAGSSSQAGIASALSAPATHPAAHS